MTFTAGFSGEFVVQIDDMHLGRTWLEEATPRDWWNVRKALLECDARLAVHVDGRKSSCKGMFMVAMPPWMTEEQVKRFLQSVDSRAEVKSSRGKKVTILTGTLQQAIEIVRAASRWVTWASEPVWA